MASMSGHGISETQPLNFLDYKSPKSLEEELSNAQKELELLKAMVRSAYIRDPFRAVEMAIEIQVQKMRVAEALSARDAMVQRLSEAYDFVRQKATVMETIYKEQERSKNISPLPVLSEADGAATNSNRVEELEGVGRKLQEEALLKKNLVKNGSKSQADPPPSYDEWKKSTLSNFGIYSEEYSPQSSRLEPCRVPFRVLKDNIDATSTVTPLANSGLKGAPKAVISDVNDLDYKVVRTPSIIPEAEELIKKRHAFLASLPLPSEIPEDSLRPIMIPAPVTLHEFLSSISGPVKISLSNYRVFQEVTTSWCPEREEHGYMLTPVFKCSTNPRVTSAHRWFEVDVLSRMNKPAECFYNKDGKWYYAGVYQAFRLDDLTKKEWEDLSSETTHALIKETIASRKNTCPQNIYETGQLYAAGALRISCIALQCIGFNNPMYRGILEHASKSTVPVKWKKVGSSTTAGNENGSCVADVADTFNGLGLAGWSSDGNDNFPEARDKK